MPLPQNTITPIIPDLLSLFGEKQLLVGHGSSFLCRNDLTERRKRVYSCPLNRLIPPKTAARIDEKVRSLLLLDHNEDSLKTDLIGSFTDNAEVRIEISLDPCGDNEGYARTKLAVRCTDNNENWNLHALNKYEWDYDSVYVTKYDKEVLSAYTPFEGLTKIRENLEETLDPQKLQNRIKTRLNSYSDNYVFGFFRKNALRRMFPKMFLPQIPRVLNPGDTFSFGWQSLANSHPVVWKVLEKKNGRALCAATNTYSTEWDVSSAEERKNITWANSELRRWLNGSFPQKSGLFSEKEDASRILPTVLRTKISLPDNKVKYEKTTDRVFILSPEKEKEHDHWFAAQSYASWTDYWQRAVEKGAEPRAAVILYRRHDPNDSVSRYNEYYYNNSTRPCMILSTD